jgi:hypothetical protein
VDLIDRGWRLHNYPERLSFSATPADYGSLLIQRRRWANGGLLILPKLLRYLRRQRISRLWLAEAYSRTHYLTSIAVVTSAVLALLFLPFEANLRSWWFPLTAVPYFALYGRDLVQAGYPGTDLFRVYTLNLMLLPINLGGVFKSLQQAWRGQKIPFARTPKGSGRVSAPATYVLAHYGLIIGLLAFTAWDLIGGRWFHAAFDAASALCFVYALVVFLGLGASLEDALRPLRAHFRPRLGLLKALPACPSSGCFKSLSVVTKLSRLGDSMRCRAMSSPPNESRRCHPGPSRRRLQPPPHQGPQPSQQRPGQHRDAHTTGLIPATWSLSQVKTLERKSTPSPPPRGHST